jgi:hypothetical protein
VNSRAVKSSPKCRGCGLELEHQKKGEAIMAKPSVSLVKEWKVVYESDEVRVEAGTAVFREDYYKVIPTSGRSKLFYGESAWSDAQRMASDLDFQAIFI